MKHLFVFLVLIFGLMLNVTPAWGQSLGDVRIAVEDRTADVRQQAIAIGLDQVLVRLTGDKEGARAGSLSSVRHEPSRWLQQFSYESATDGSLELLIHFDVAVLLRQLEQAAVPIWTVTRPDTLFWLVVQRSAGGEILSEGSADPAAQALYQAAQQRGLPARLPQMDSEDRSRIQAADIRGQFDQVLSQAARRYQPIYNVTAVLYPGAMPQLRWRLLHQGRVEKSGDISAASEQQAIADLIDQVTSYIAPLYTVRSGEALPYQLQVEGVLSLQDWHAINAHISTLAGVRDLNVGSLEGGQLGLTLNFSGAAAQLRALLGLAPRLVECAGQNYSAQSSPARLEAADTVSAPPRQPLKFCWQPESST